MNFLNMHSRTILSEIEKVKHFLRSTSKQGKSLALLRIYVEAQFLEVEKVKMSPISDALKFIGDIKLTE